VKEIRFHGRGGQGVVTAAEILAAAFVREGKFVAAFPMFGFERRGAPVTAFLRFDAQPIRERTQVYTPDCCVVIDPVLARIPDTYQGLKPGGVVVANIAAESMPAGVAVGMLVAVPATAIALEELRRPAANTAVLGGLACATGWISVGFIQDTLADYFNGAALAGNRKAVQRGYDEAILIKAEEATHAVS
jgi:2-oxoisovalerate/pyruvate ferredoxin oxidoreductase gamma subunit